MSSIQNMINKWTAENEALKPQTVVKGGAIPTASIMAYQTRLNCINDLKQHQKESAEYVSDVKNLIK